MELGDVGRLPREDQLRERLGGYFLSMDAGPDGYVVTLSGPDRAHHTAPEASAADAYGRALLYVVSQATAAAR